MVATSFSGASSKIFALHQYPMGPVLSGVLKHKFYKEKFVFYEDKFPAGKFASSRNTEPIGISPGAKILWEISCKSVHTVIYFTVS